jgi:hypothetical protein
MGGLAKIFSAPEKPDTSDLERQEAEARAREQVDRRKSKATLVAARQGSRFRLFSETTGERGLRETLG